MTEMKASFCPDYTGKEDGAFPHTNEFVCTHAQYYSMEEEMKQKLLTMSQNQPGNRQM